MKVGILADIHDNVDNLRHAVRLLNSLNCRLILIAGDFVSPLVVPSLRKLHGRVIACLGDNDGNIRGIQGGMSIVGTLGYGALCLRTEDGVRILMAHQLQDVRECIDEADVVVFAHTHRSSVATDRNGRVFINPGEVGGWMFRKPSVAVFDTQSRTAEIVELPEMLPPVFLEG